MQKVSLSLHAPHVLRKSKPHDFDFPKPQGIPASKDQHLPLRDAYPYGLSHHLRPLSLQEMNHLRSIFSSQRGTIFYKTVALFFADNSSLPNGR
jgi:hypothetical protein